MSARRRSRKRNRFSPPSSPNLRVVDKIEPPDEAPASVAYAEAKDHAIAIHRFLMVVAQDAMVGEVDPVKSLAEVMRVVEKEAALVLIHDGRMVGTMGIIAADWWYSADRFMTDRWHFVLPEYKNTPHAALLLQEALAIAKAAGLPFIHQGKMRKGLMSPRIYRPE